MKSKGNTPFKIISNYESVREKTVFANLLKVLMAYALKLIGDSTLRLKKNKADLAYDFAMETIQKYLENPEKFDPLRNQDLVLYLKFNILRRLISNYKNLEGQKNELLYEQDDSNGITVENSFTETLDIHVSIDLNCSVERIREAIESDENLIPVFDLRYIKDYKPAEVMEELNITQGEYNNRIRRLDTVRKRIISNVVQQIN